MQCDNLGFSDSSTLTLPSCSTATKRWHAGQRRCSLTGMDSFSPHGQLAAQMADGSSVPRIVLLITAGETSGGNGICKRWRQPGQLNLLPAKLRGASSAFLHFGQL
jgi:hypothetical protein